MVLEFDTPLSADGKPRSTLTTPTPTRAPTIQLPLSGGSPQERNEVESTPDPPSSPLLQRQERAKEGRDNIWMYGLSGVGNYRGPETCKLVTIDRVKLGHLDRRASIQLS
jgi:hypothetical protein